MNSCAEEASDFETGKQISSIATTIYACWQRGHTAKEASDENLATANKGSAFQLHPVGGLPFGGRLDSPASFRSGAVHGDGCFPQGAARQRKGRQDTRRHQGRRRPRAG